MYFFFFIKVYRWDKMKELGRKLEKIIRKIRRLPSIDKNKLNEIVQDLQRTMLSADVKVELVFEMTENIKSAILKSKLMRAKLKNFIIALVHEELIKILTSYVLFCQRSRGFENLNSY